MNEASYDTPRDADSTGQGTKRPLDSAGSSKKGDKSKRLRVSRACDQCRAARERCDGAQPTCSTCLQADRSCSYKEQPKKRGIQPNYIRTLELTLAWLFQSFPDAERRLAEVLPNSEGRPHQTIAFKDVPSADALHRVWRNGIVCRQIDQMLSGAEIEVAQAAYIEQNTARPAQVDERNVPYQSPPLSAPSDIGPLQLENEQPVDLSEPATLQQNTFGREEGDGQRLRLPQNAWVLLEHYFAFTQTWLPITEKHDVLRLMYAYPQDGLLKTEALASEHAELWSIMAWSAFCNNPNDVCFETYKEVAKTLIPSSGFQFGHVKALLILNLIELSRGAWAAAWLTVGIAVSILTHLASDVESEGSLSRGRTRHIFLAAYLLESTVSSRTGALTHLRTADVHPMGLLIEDGLEEWSPWSDPGATAPGASAKQPARSISTFNELMRLALAMRNTTSPVSETGQRGLMHVVLELLNNAGASSGRRHPASLVADRVSSQTSSQRDSNDSGKRPSSSATQPPLDHFDFDYWQTHGSSSLGRGGEQQSYPFMSIPNEQTESLSGETPARGSVTGTTPSMWQTKEAQAGASSSANFASTNDVPSVGPSADIFEELAILDRTDSSQNPRFLQNLGFGPDLDLAEFFGADYQPSDPMLNYMQPDQFGDIPREYDNAGSGAG